MKTHRKQHSSLIFSRYWRVYSKEGQYRGCRDILICRRQVLKLAREMESRRNMVGITSTDTRWTYNKGIIILGEASMIRYTSCPWAWTQGSRSTPTCSSHNLSLTSRVWWSCSVEKFYLEKYQKSLTHENFRVHTYYGRHRFNPSGHLRIIYQNL